MAWCTLVLPRAHCTTALLCTEPDISWDTFYGPDGMSQGSGEEVWIDNK
jgi:hypothetical protein